MRRHCGVLALMIACLGGPARAVPVGPPDTFEGDAVGSFPAGWIDVVAADSASTAPKPSAVVVSTTNAFGNPTKAAAILPKVLGTLPATGPAQGFYRPIAPMSFYSMSADFRIDRFSDVTNFDCGCPPELYAATDTPMQIGFGFAEDIADFASATALVIYPSARTRGWRLFAHTQNVAADFDLGLPATVGKWYGVQLDLNAAAGAVHSLITDAATGVTLADVVTSLPASWDPAVDGVLNLESFNSLELTALTTSGLATVDNIDLAVPEPATMLLLASALAVGAAVRRRNVRKSCRPCENSGP
jgi:hypothetical protein